jgi:ABC-type transport system involved in multi-copper enzyme maturation permease subunit
MIRAIAWKEFREQGLIALTLVVLGGGLLTAAAVLAERPSPGATPTDVVRFLGIGQLATLMLAVTAGMVCGGAVFAAEREAATFQFLDSLPASRWQIWCAKVFSGLALAFVQIAVLVALAAALDLVPNVGRAVAFIVYSLLAFVWGVFGSTTARTTLGSVGIAIPAATLTAFFVLVPVTLAFQGPTTSVPRMNGAIFFLVCMFAVPLLLSAWLFTGLDRTRAADETSRAWLRGAPRVVFAPRPQLSVLVPVRAPRRPRFGLLAIVWLTSRQLLVPGLVLSLFAFLFGLALLVPQGQPFIVWPGLALTAGVLAGVTTFSDEQTRGAARYWGEQRLPITRLWMLKITLHLLFCLWLLALLALPLVVRTQFEDLERLIRTHTFLATVFRTPLFDELGYQGWKYLLVPAIYGFAAGHICGLVFRKLVVACGVAGIVGAVCAALWGPSILAGGVKHWQLWLPPIAMLATGFLVLRAWVSERVPTRPAIIRLVAGSLGTVLILAIGISYRVLEIPLRDGSEDDIAYVEDMKVRTPIDGKHGGREFKVAAERFNRLTSSINPSFDRAEFPTRVTRRDRIEDRADTVLRTGWSDREEALARWLDALFLPSTDSEPAWFTSAEKATDAPIGIFEYPQMLGLAGPSTPALEYAQRMAVALLVRGLQHQELNPDEFPERLRTVLALARTLRNGSIIASFLAGADVERAGLLALDQWLARLPYDSPRIRPLIDLLQNAEPTQPFDPTPHFLAERHVLREGMKTPAQWLPVLLATPGANPDATTTEVDLVGLAWAVPWERERTRRVVAMGFEAGLPTSHSTVIGRPGLGLLIGRARSPRELIEFDRLLTTHRRAAILKLALRAYRSDRGKYPNSLADLESAGYLRQAPRDPYSTNQTFGYRLSQPPGDLLVNPTRLSTDRPGGVLIGASGVIESVRVPAGHPILWSVGLDGIDQQGRNIPAGLMLGQARPADLVYLVPPGEEKPAGPD